MLAKTLAEAHELVDRAKRQRRELEEKHGKKFATAAHSIEAGGTAFGLGYANARWGDEHEALTVGGIPVDITLGLLIHGLAFTVGFGSDAINGHAHAIGSGALAAYGYRAGQAMGRASKLDHAHALMQAQGQAPALPTGQPPWWLANQPPQQFPAQPPAPQAAPGVAAQPPGR